ncbi:MAG: hypothetical protein ACXVXJ_13080, partial [Mycobacteriaceae bacterium]
MFVKRSGITSSLVGLASTTVLMATARAAAPPRAAAAATTSHAPSVPKDPSGRVVAVSPRPAPKPVWPTGTQVAKPWPAPGQATVGLSQAAQRAGQLPVTLRAVSKPSLPSTTLTLWPRATGQQLGRGADSMVLSLSGDRSTGIDVDIDASAAATNTGGDWLARTSLVELTGCTVTATTISGCTSTHPLATTTTGQGHLIATLPATSQRSGGTTAIAPQMAVMATSTSSSGPAGSFAATPLAASSSWSAGGQSGSFAWNQSLALPPVPGDLTPTVTAAYDSGSVDGRVASSNNQPSWLGDGFALDPSGYIERRYVACSQDMTGGNNTVSTGDNCWKSDNA